MHVSLTGYATAVPEKLRARVEQLPYGNTLCPCQCRGRVTSAVTAPLALRAGVFSSLFGLTLSERSPASHAGS